MRTDRDAGYIPSVTASLMITAVGAGTLEIKEHPDFWL